MLRGMKFWLLAALLCLGLVAAETDSTKAKIEALLAAVEKSDAKFVRNGDEHTGKEAAEHMRRKYDHFKKEIKTPEDFIAKCATKSELSGKPYMIKLPDGKSIKAEDWMKGKLVELEKKPKLDSQSSPK
jgi:hypothetical protein